MRYFIELAFNGADFYGWQRQPNVISVQETLEEKLAIVLQKDTEIIGAGRTDTGVHARQIFAHFEAEEIPDYQLFLYKLNGMLPKSIAVKNVYKMFPEAHARFDATAREYQYFIDLEKNPFTEKYALFIKNKLDVEAMNEAAGILLAYKDFQCFSKSRTDVFTYNCDIEYAYWKKKDHQLVFTIKANRFLRNMVRAIVGTLIEIGSGKKTVEQMHEIIQSKSRSEAGVSVEAKGLFLTKVEYPSSIFLTENE
ncbi:tRNA pseudouridine(38-40) synthase TruA [Mesonia sp. K7]|uniref:tRNA pseudouridine(38-40) synthase TruA n=1 Tax=Mesonia sp. K7 TaxID=2218606 RepID=UPI000DA823CC|nr:tRNA pseudouridine(38-40) synthase TruA [Mesonia sp. K7]PZD78035.1 tRNA pseudouridine(38-40) synthase TruA [Mesonia sp. K7]